MTSSQIRHDHFCHETIHYGEISGNFYSQLHSFFILCNHCFSSGKLAIGIGNSYSSFKCRVDSLFHISSSVIWNNLCKHIVVNCKICVPYFLMEFFNSPFDSTGKKCLPADIRNFSPLWDRIRWNRPHRCSTSHPPFPTHR